MTYVRKTTSDGRPLTLWHIARPMRTSPAGRITGCGHVVDSPWPEATAGWTHRQHSDELPAREERCTANGCRQRWETP